MRRDECGALPRRRYAAGGWWLISGGGWLRLTWLFAVWQTRLHDYRFKRIGLFRFGERELDFGLSLQVRLAARLNGQAGGEPAVAGVTLPDVEGGHGCGQILFSGRLALC